MTPRAGLTVQVDRARCAGAGLCLLAVPEVFDQSEEDGKVLLLAAAPAQTLARRIRAAAVRCPAAAITVRGGEA